LTTKTSALNVCAVEQQTPQRATAIAVVVLQKRSDAMEELCASELVQTSYQQQVQLQKYKEILGVIFEFPKRVGGGGEASMTT
jgi:hypothetical protein